ncbi:MAG: thioredoxin family protein [Leptospiraceae bacterium]|nr:thioredoxin family protein [Leptospiraceae bacterium]
MKEINTEQFEDILKDTKPVILDFYSDECPPCESLAPK